MIMRGSKCLLAVVSSAYGAAYSPYDVHYAQGIHAYESENWSEAISEINRAIEERNRYLEAKVHCSIDSCGNVTGDSLKNTIGSGFSQYVIARGLCLYKCMSAQIGEKYVDWRILPSIDEEFQARLPYQYLNVAYYKIGNIRKAVESGFTFFNADPSDPEMQDTLAFYQELEEVDDSMFVDVENPEHLKHYEKAQSVYQFEDYAEAITEFEESLHWYWDSMDECRALCDKPFDFGQDYPDELPNYHLFQTKMVAQLLECRLKCVKQMELPCGRYHRRSNSDLLPIHYHYLMFAYHEIGDEVKAASMAKTYLTFHPDNEPMQLNIQYLDQEAYQAAEPDKKASKFYKKIMREAKMLEYLQHHFGPKYGFKYDYALLTPFPDESFFEEEDERLMNEDIGEIDENTQTPWDPDHEVKEPPTSFGPSYNTPFPTGAEIGYESVAEKIDDLLFDPLADPDKIKQIDTIHGKLPYYSAGDEKFGYVVRDSPKYAVFDDGPAVDAEGPVVDGAVLKQNSTHLAGPTRFVMDGILSEEQCSSLFDLAMSGVVGDGYEGDKRPHSKGEEFAGISLLTAARLADIGAVDVAAVQLYHDINFKLANTVKEYFKLDTDLYIDYIHLVCRDPKDTETKDDEGNILLSHPVHPDNCLYLPDGTCPRRPPAYVWREYSAVLYLNENIEGGEIFFADPSGKYALVGVKPKCGRLVGFCAGTDCLHGVKKLTGGKRCALPIWYTTKKEKEDFTLDDARAILKRLNSDSNSGSSDSDKLSAENYEQKTEL